MSIKLALILVAVLGLAGGGFYEGWSFGSGHVQAQWNADKLARDAVLQKAQADVIEKEQARAQLEAVVEHDHETVAVQNSQLESADAQRLHDASAAIRRCLLPAAVGNPASVQPGSALPAGDGDIEARLGRLESDLQAAEAAGYADAADLASILALRPH